jgi:hypothetical protein
MKKGKSGIKGVFDTIAQFFISLFRMRRSKEKEIENKYDSPSYDHR